MFDFNTRVLLVDSETGTEYSLNLLSPDRVRPPFHTFTVSMRSFDVHATVPLSSSYHIRVEHDQWQQLCHVSTYQVCCRVELLYTSVYCPVEPPNFYLSFQILRIRTIDLAAPVDTAAASRIFAGCSRRQQHISPVGVGCLVLGDARVLMRVCICTARLV
jgi:hypothetical protein